MGELELEPTSSIFGEARLVRNDSSFANKMFVQFYTNFKQLFLKFLIQIIIMRNKLTDCVNYFLESECVLRKARKSSTTIFELSPSLYFIGDAPTELFSATQR